jgi:transposase
VESRAKSLPCPQCGADCTRYDHRVRRWRHLDTCQFRTLLVAKVPRLSCPEHGVVQAAVPWAEPGSRFTALFEALVIDWLKEASLSAVARQLNLSWDEADTIMQRAVARGLERRAPVAPKRIGVDETSYRKGHDYVTVVTDLGSSRVLHVADGRSMDSLGGFYEGLTGEQREGIEAVAMDMWKAYISATRKALPDADEKICFDRFHVAQHLGNAVDKVRRREHKELGGREHSPLTGSRWLWLTNRENMSREAWSSTFRVLREMALQTSRAWALKHAASKLWSYVRRGWAERMWKRWLAWAARSRLQPMIAVGKMIRNHLWGIVNAIILKVTNALGESRNAQIQRVKKMACGFRNRARFRAAIYFHLGGLDLYPAGVTHTKA